MITIDGFNGIKARMRDAFDSGIKEYQIEALNYVYNGAIWSKNNTFDEMNDFCGQELTYVFTQSGNIKDFYPVVTVECPNCKKVNNVRRIKFGTKTSFCQRCNKYVYTK